MTATTVTTSSTGLQGRLLGILVSDGRVWSHEELAERLADEAETGRDFGGGTVTQALDALIAGGLAHRVSRDLVTASRLGMRSGEGVDPGDGAVLQVPASSDGGVGVVELSNDPDATDRLCGGAENLPRGLDVVGARSTD
jgi:hypothetical protein